MSEPLFVSQSLLEGWLERGEVSFSDGILTLRDGQHNRPTTYKLESAVKIVGILDGEDRDHWLGQILSDSTLAQAGAEHLQDSVLKGNTAYKCEEGFLGKEHPAAVPGPLKGAPSIIPIAGAAPSSGTPKTGSKAPLPPPAFRAPTGGVVESKPADAPNADEMKTLTDFLLKNLG